MAELQSQPRSPRVDFSSLASFLAPSLAAIWASVTCLGLLGCASRDRVTQVAQIYSHQQNDATLTQHDPIVVVPGFLGSYLQHPGTGEIAWGRFFGEQRTIKDPDFARLLALPVGDAQLSDLRDELVPTKVLRVAEMELGKRTIRLNAYPGVLTGIMLGWDADEKPSRHTLTQHAKRADDADIPLLDEVAYDWRRDVAEAARQLDSHLDHSIAIAKAHRREVGLPVDDVRIDAIGHSTGCLVLRYYLRYGSQPLPKNGSVPPPTWEGSKKVRRAFFVAPPNLGTLEAFEGAAFGSNPAPILPKFPAPLLGTFVSLYQLMPSPDAGAVVYEDGTHIDLYDPAVWERHGWGLFATGERVSLETLLPELDAQSRLDYARRYQKRVLDSAKQLHAALASEHASPRHTSLHLFVSDTRPTSARLVIERATGRRIKTEQAQGDGTVTRASALGDLERTSSHLDRLRTPVDWSSVHWVSGDHMSMTGEADLIDNILYMLFEHPPPRGPSTTASSTGPKTVGQATLDND